MAVKRLFAGLLLASVTCPAFAPSDRCSTCGATDRPRTGIETARSRSEAPSPPRGSATHGPAATEAQFLFARYVFDELGYRRYEWKCHNRNEPSKRAAERFGFTFEGIFRQHMVAKGENRDTAWYSIIDSEWPALRKAYEGWLDPSNFDSDGNQKRRLEDFRKSLA